MEHHCWFLQFHCQLEESATRPSRHVFRWYVLGWPTNWRSVYFFYKFLLSWEWEMVIWSQFHIMALFWTKFVESNSVQLITWNISIPFVHCVIAISVKQNTLMNETLIISFVQVFFGLWHYALATWNAGCNIRSANCCGIYWGTSWYMTETFNLLL